MPEASAVFKDCQGRWRTCFVFVYFSHKSLWPLDYCAPKYQGIQNSLAYNFSNGIASPPTWIDLGHGVFQMVSHRQELLPATQQPSNIISTEQNSSKTVHCNYWEQFGYWALLSSADGSHLFNGGDHRGRVLVPGSLLSTSRPNGSEALMRYHTFEQFLKYKMAAL